MASFHNKKLKKHDDYLTPKYAWENILEFIPKNKIIWEPFYCEGTSGKILGELGLKVIHKDIDFFIHDLGDIIITNPPFSIKEKVLTRLKELGKPFILILPSPTMTCQYIRKLFAEEKDRLQLIIPRRRIQFIKVEDKKLSTPNKCNFDSWYYCWKMNLPHDIIWLNSLSEKQKSVRILKLSKN